MTTVENAPTPQPVLKIAIDTDPSLVPKMSPRQELAVLARALFRVGYRDHTFGHISYRLDDGTFLVTPFEFEWDELRACDILRIDGSGNVLEGRWNPNPAIVLHLTLHRARHDVQIAVHNHPMYSTVYSAAGRIPPAYDQTSSMATSEQITFFKDYAGNATSQESADANVAAIADKNIAILANHGVLVLGSSLNDIYLKCSTLEWRSRLAWHVEALTDRAQQMDPNEQVIFNAFIARLGKAPHVWEAAARREVRNDPNVLFDDWTKAEVFA